MGRSAARLAAMVIGVTIAVACGESSPDPSGSAGSKATPDANGEYDYEDAVVAGVVRGADGKAARGYDVSVSRQSTDGSTSSGFARRLVQGRLSPGDDDVVATGPLTRSGGYERTLPDAYLPGFETDDDWFVSAERPPRKGERRGPTSSFELEVNSKRQEAPPLAIWDSTLVAHEDGVLVTYTAGDPPDIEHDEGQEDTFFIDDEGALVFVTRTLGLDARLLEDAHVNVVRVRSASVRVDHANGNTIYHERIATATIEHEGTLVPASRGATCTLTIDQASVPCGLTDGDLLEGLEVAGPTGATIDLGELREIGLVVVRGSGAPGEGRFEVSADGATWESLQTDDASDAHFPFAEVASPSSPTEARFVRFADAGGLTEVSVWEPAAGRDSSPERGLFTAPVRPTDGESPSAALVALAALLIGGTVTAAVVLLRSANDPERGRHAARRPR